MTPPKKSEWLQIADTDNAASVRKVSKTLPSIALGSALLVIGAGAMLAQSNVEAPALAVSPVVTSTQPVSQNAPAARSTKPTFQAQNINVQSTSAQSNVAPSSPKAPGIQAPTGRGGDDEGREHEGGEDD
jgi:hypothetical protein